MRVLAFQRVTPKAEGYENETPKASRGEKCGGVSPQLTSAVSFPAGSMAEPWPKTNLVYSRTVRKPVVAITLIIQCQNKIAVTRLITYSPCVEYGWLCFSHSRPETHQRGFMLSIGKGAEPTLAPQSSLHFNHRLSLNISVDTC